MEKGYNPPRSAFALTPKWAIPILNRSQATYNHNPVSASFKEAGYAPESIARRLAHDAGSD